MKRLGEVMRGRPARDEEREMVVQVLDLSLQWQDGAITLQDVRTQSSGWDRFTAVRFADLGSEEKQDVMRLLEALAKDDDERRRTERERPDQYRGGGDRPGAPLRFPSRPG